MQYLTEKQLRNLSVESLDEIRREVGTSIGSAKHSFEQNGAKADYVHQRLLEKYLTKVKAVLTAKRNVLNQ
ncbi:hypothetical protein AU156_gp112 [Edwardsiella phage PEi20]|uniref:Uncharacterized protein n=2 Tax=Kanagawavirus pei20 TaxID=2844109 RepID=A0A0B6VRH3_9CAUD|nr:hypothetical protein AU156_gp112 [Edwardsiella phage PEi20]BAQ22762.1 conserved hypothetical protein [Edwardsiella phage PEi20]BAQ23064.1 conserved hypothetical protein [Edwardsiella phage PEi26]